MSSFEERFPNFVPLTAEELKARGKEKSEYYGDKTLDLTVDRISKEKSPEERLAKLRAVFGNSTRGSWGTALRSIGTSTEAIPIVGHSIGAPVCEFARPGAREKDFADMRFIVAAHGNFEWLLELAAEALEARKEKGPA